MSNQNANLTNLDQDERGLEDFKGRNRRPHLRISKYFD